MCIWLVQFLLSAYISVYKGRAKWLLGNKMMKLQEK